MRILCIGSGPTAAADIFRAHDNGPFDLTVATNCAAERHAADVQITLHPHKYAHCKAARWLVSHHIIPGVDEQFPYRWHGHASSGSSGLYAVGYALQIRRASLVVLAGIGMDVSPHEYGGADWTEALRYRDAWVHALPLMRGRVVSMSGWTKKLLD